jgi:hypothetical protein
MNTGLLEADLGGNDTNQSVTNWNLDLETVVSSLTWSTDAILLV